MEFIVEVLFLKCPATVARQSNTSSLSNFKFGVHRLKLIENQFYSKTNCKRCQFPFLMLATFMHPIPKQTIKYIISKRFITKTG